MHNQRDITNHELFTFMQDFKQFVEENMFMRADFNEFLENDFRLLKEIVDNNSRILRGHTQTLDGLSTSVRTIQQELIFDRKRISRVEFRTQKLLGKKLGDTDRNFEEQYLGEKI